MAVTLTIGGASKAYRVGSLRISSPVNGRQTASFDVRSNDGTYRPAVDADVVIANGATTLVGGLVDSPEEEGILGDETGGYDAISTRVNAISYFAYAERRYVNMTLAAGTFKSQLEALRAEYLDVFSITLDAGQVDGPTMPELNYEFVRLSDVFNELTTVTAKYGEPFAIAISATKVLSGKQPSTVAAPFDITDGDGNTFGDITVDRTRHNYANRIFLQVPSKTELQHQETFTGDGSTTVFPLQYSIIDGAGVVVRDGVYFETLTLDPVFSGSAYWTYDPVANTLTREVGAPDVASSISITFNGRFEGTATAEDVGEIAARGPVERVITVKSVPSDTTAQALADGYLAKALATTQIVKYKTFREGLEPGMSQHVTSALRDIDDDYVISEVSIGDYGTSKGARPLEYAVTLTLGINAEEGWRDTPNLWAGDTTGGSLASVAVGEGAPAATSGGPGAPDKSVQYNRSGIFGGDAAFLYHEEQNSVQCGGGGTAITATDFESCQAFGDNCQIID